MPINPKYLAKLEPGKLFHVYNRSHSGLLLFKTGDDYNRFLIKTEKYLLPYIEMYSYSLLPNHFHFFFLYKDIPETVYKNQYTTPDEFLCEQFRCLFISHTKYMNKKYEKHGGLFSRPFRRIEVVGMAYAIQMIYYIHWNHVHHGLSTRLEDYIFNSYHEFLIDCPSIVNKKVVLEWFGGKENFIKEHLLNGAHYLNVKFGIE